jgi:hypothetical protein
LDSSSWIRCCTVSSRCLHNSVRNKAHRSSVLMEFMSRSCTWWNIISDTTHSHQIKKAYQRKSRDHLFSRSIGAFFYLKSKIINAKGPSACRGQIRSPIFLIFVFAENC